MTLLQQRLGFAHDAALSNTLPVRMLDAGGFATVGPLARTLGQTDGISPAPVATLLDRRPEKGTLRKAPISALKMITCDSKLSHQ